MESLKAYRRVISDKMREKWESSFKFHSVKRMKGDNPWNHWYNVLRTPVTKVDDQLWLGSAFDAANKGTLDSCGIKTIINCSLELDHYFIQSGEYIYLRVPILDVGTSDMSDHFQTVINWFQQAEKPILLHCYMGSSRSAILAVLWLIKMRGMQFDAAMKYLLEKRPVVNINLVYLLQLRNFLTLER
jgi:protein tyrosine phosphatase (PTP) superfamily phosphohydrolase (DUF442 family)